MTIGKQQGFTLIELLIVVAIIAILAAIAIPNFLEAQVRSKVSREKANMRSIATALEAYRTDNTHYPSERRVFQLSGFPVDYVENKLYLSQITTPIAYMTNIPDAIFRNNLTYNGAPIGRSRFYEYEGEVAKEDQRVRFIIGVFGLPDPPQTSAIWSLTSWGPDRRYNDGHDLVFGEAVLNSIPVHGVPPNEVGPGALYDSTNGTISNGDIVRVGP